MPAIRMDWCNLLFLHWQVPVSALRPLVPARLEIDTHQGRAYIGLVPFTMRGVRHVGLPPIPTMHHFHECNVRTYVHDGTKSGVWFFSLDAESRLAVWGARRLWNLPYFKSDITLRREGARTQYGVQRRGSQARTACTWEAGPPLPRSTPGSLEYFLTERYALYAEDRRGRIWRGDVEHEPWSLQAATLLELDDTLVQAAGVEVPTTSPLAHHAERIETTAQPLKRLDPR